MSFSTRFGRTLAPYRQLCRANASLSSTRPGNFVKIVEVGPRDGLQNEPNPVSTEVKVELINRLGKAGLSVIEAGSFVSPKWVPQMAGTADVLQAMNRLPNVRYPVLVPNQHGLSSLINLLSTKPSLTDEIAIFVAASESFSRANINCSIAESLTRLAPVIQKAKEAGLRVRGYVSTVITCPFEGSIAPERVRDVSHQLTEMGCYEVSLGDTVGTGTSKTMEAMLSSVMSCVPIEQLAVHNHDTFGMGIANVMTAINMGIRAVDSSVSGLGGCPYSPGATGNVATEDVVHALHGANFQTGVDLDILVDTGSWVSEQLNRQNASRAGLALLARRKRMASANHQANKTESS